MTGRVNIQHRMSAAALCLGMLVFLFGIGATSADPIPPDISAGSAILMDAATGEVLFEKDCHARRFPASTTKIMTAILALENRKLDDLVYASEYACKTQFASLHLKPGECLTMQNLLYGLLLRSANDAAVCIAENVAGSEEQFVAMMNAKAKEIGANNTHFVNPHGLHDPNHYSTAYDLALIARYAIRKPEFNEIVRTKSKRIERSINTADVSLISTARLLGKLYGADGIKTGYTKQAGYCFVGSATRNDWRLISVVLKSKDSIGDSAALLNYGFKYFRSVTFARAGRPVKRVPVSGGVVEEVNLLPGGDLAFIVRKNAAADAQTKIEVSKVHAPVKKGEKVGTLTGFLNGRMVGVVDLVAAESVDRTLGATVLHFIKLVVITICLAIVGFITYGTAVAKVARRRRRGIPSRSGEVDYFGTRRSQRRDGHPTRSEG